MKKITLLIISLIATNAYASTDAEKLESLKKQKEEVSYSGINYPQPLVNGSEKTSSLSDLLSDKITVNSNGSNKSDISEMRSDAIIEIAYALGSSGGLVHRTKEIKQQIDSQAVNLDKLFDFSKMKIDNGVIAPILTEGLSNYTQKNSDQVRIADKMYTIEEPAKFVSVYPTWRNYLKFSYPTYDVPSAAYLPKNAAEKALWDKTIKEGWNKGIQQANIIFESSYNRLDRDYKGMIKYKILVAEGLITPTIISKQNLGVTGGGKSMSINDQVFRITDHSALNPNQKDWKVEYPVTNNTNGEYK